MKLLDHSTKLITQTIKSGPEKTATMRLYLKIFQSCPKKNNTLFTYTE